MNRWDEIRAAALDVAQYVTQDPATRAAMAEDLITLAGLMIRAVDERNGHAPDCNDRCPECNRIERFGHMFNCSQRESARVVANPAVPHCPECNRAEGDGHARRCRLAGCVAVHMPHDLDCNGT